MSNEFNFGAMKQKTGWIAFWRLVHHAENRVLRNGQHDVLFATKEEAEAAAKAEFLKQMNSTIVSEALSGPTTQKALAKHQADKLFTKGKTIEVTRIGGEA